MNDEHTTTSDPAVGSTRLVRLRGEWRDDGLMAAYLAIGRVEFGIGWVPGWWRLPNCRAFACNRTYSWAEHRKLCLSLLWLRIGFKVLPNRRG